MADKKREIQRRVGCHARRRGFVQLRVCLGQAVVALPWREAGVKHGRGFRRETRLARGSFGRKTHASISPTCTQVSCTHTHIQVLLYERRITMQSYCSAEILVEGCPNIGKGAGTAAIRMRDAGARGGGRGRGGGDISQKKMFFFGESRRREVPSSERGGYTRGEKARLHISQNQLFFTYSKTIFENHFRGRVTCAEVVISCDIFFGFSSSLGVPSPRESRSILRILKMENVVNTRRDECMCRVLGCWKNKYTQIHSPSDSCQP